MSLSSLTISGSMRAHIIALILPTLSATVVAIFTSTIFVWILTTASVSVASHCTITFCINIRAWLSSSWGLFTITCFNWLRYCLLASSRLLSLHLLMLRLRTSIGWLKMFQIGILCWAWRIVISSLIRVVVWIV